MNPLRKKNIRKSRIIEDIDDRREITGKVTSITNEKDRTVIDWIQTDGVKRTTVFRLSSWDSRILGAVTYLYRTVLDGIDDNGADRFILIAGN